MMTNPNPTPTSPAHHQFTASAPVPTPAPVSASFTAPAGIPAGVSDTVHTAHAALPDVLSTFEASDTSGAEGFPVGNGVGNSADNAAGYPVGDSAGNSAGYPTVDADFSAAADAAAESNAPSDPSAPPAPPAPDGLPAPSEQMLMNELAPLRAQYPRMDFQAVIASEVFRDFGESVGWDSRELTARLPQLIEASRALTLAVEPPVSRVTAAAASHRRPLLSPNQQKELAAWNRDYPAYRMTELEYFNALGK